MYNLTGKMSSTNGKNNYILKIYIKKNIYVKLNLL